MDESAVAADPYLHKVVSFRYAGQELRLRVSQDLFSSYDVDVGTQRLLRTLRRAEDGAFRRILDLGCGYGPLGLALKKADAARTVHMVDRDALAVAYARQNAALNGLAGVEVYASLGYDDVVVRDFDLIVCNVPAKAGRPVIGHLLLDARHYLRPGGRVAIVVVDDLQPLAAEILSAPDIEVLHRETWPGHTVWHYCFREPAPTAARAESAMERGIYYRADTVVAHRGLTLALQTAYGLPESDRLGPRSELLLKGLLDIRRPIRQALAFNPGQGYVPAALWTLFRPGRLLLVDRDLLSLRWSQRNLLRSGCPAECLTLYHQVGLAVPGGAGVDLVAGIWREEEGRPAMAQALAQAAEQTAAGAQVVLAASSTAVTRLVGLLRADGRFRVRQRERRKGESLLVLMRR